MCVRSRWITPFVKQCFVTSGVSLNLLAHGLVVGFGSVLLPQLKESQFIPIDDEAGSWIASIVGFALITGAVIVPSIMSKWGRKVANLISAIIMTASWFCVIIATGISSMLVGRFLQGLSMGFTASLGSILIGEYTSPRNRGAFLTTISLAIATGVLIIHILGSFLSWQETALVCAFIAFADLVIIVYSPESPSFLAANGRYEECRKVFHWLRGFDEDEELEKMIKTDMLNRRADQVSGNLSLTFKKGCRYVNETLRKREFYKPIILVIHLYSLNQWSGANILSSYTTDIFHTIVGSDVKISLMIISMDIQRILSNIIAIIVIKKVRRRPMLMATVSINIIAYLLIAGYVYARNLHLLPFDHPLIGVLLLHLHMFSIATGTIPLPNVIAGEVFPLEYRGLAGMITVLFLSLNLFVTIKTVPFLFTEIGLYGAYCLYAGVVGYCLMVSWFMLPETKDKTLQDIEEEFRGGNKLEMNSAVSVESILYCDMDNKHTRRRSFS